MKPLNEQITALRNEGYSAVLASAKVVHDVVMRAISRSGFKVNGTLKGGVVMSALTKDIRRATLDMDIDFIHHPISEAGVRRFVSRLAKSMPEIDMAIRGRVVDLRHEDYRGKRIFLAVKDGSVPRWIRTKMDIGVHTHESIRQVDVRFDIPDGRPIRLSRSLRRNCLAFCGMAWSPIGRRTCMTFTICPMRCQSGN